MEHCSSCGKQIPKIRLEILPNTPFCVGCSTTPARLADEIALDGPEASELVKSMTNRERQGGD